MVILPSQSISPPGHEYTTQPWKPTDYELTIIKMENIFKFSLWLGPEVRNIWHPFVAADYLYF